MKKLALRFLSLLQLSLQVFELLLQVSDAAGVVGAPKPVKRPKYQPKKMPAS
jgi:hypothetical protein